jgi:hypothetical protein
MNHDTLRRHRYRPDVEIGPDLLKKASEEHRKLSTAYDDLRAQKKKEVEDRVLKRAQNCFMWSVPISPMEKRLPMDRT